jgi:hypothetical protein
MKDRPPMERLVALRNGAYRGLGAWGAEEVFAEIDALTAELAEARRDLALSRAREREALRRGFDAGQRYNYDEDRPEFPTWEHYQKHLGELEEHAAREIRIAEAEEAERIAEAQEQKKDQA